MPYGEIALFGANWCGLCCDRGESPDEEQEHGQWGAFSAEATVWKRAFWDPKRLP